MTPERWKQIEEVFQTALDLPTAGRADFVARSCAGDDELRRQVEALVAQHDEAGDFIENPAVAISGLVGGDGDPLATNPSADGIFAANPAIGQRVGSYRLIGELGRGGMGAVYLAERADSAFRLRAAVKLIKRGMDTDFILRRFRNERQILASLDHPHIARLLDGGTTEDGLPYFVMEYIDGLPLFEYCDSRRLDVDTRLRLFARICAAVHYAHQHLVIHRDIKPSNILVTAAGAPKLLDFGIAKLLNPDMADTTLDPTATAMRLMTPEYASPEQVQGQPVTPTTDVYSLGVLLYELLTGHRPYRLRSRAPHDVARVICEEEPPHPSVVVASREDLINSRATGDLEVAFERLLASRATTVEQLRGELAGDLDNIILKALRKDPAARYASAEELREDIERRLARRPVSAPPAFSALRPVHKSEPPAEADEKSLAVLPLKQLDPRQDGDTGDDYLGVGLADALITRLGSLRRFSLRPTSSVLRFGDTEVDPLAAGRELGVAYVLDGRIHRAGQSIRITMQLLEVRSGSAVWAGKFDENFTDVLQLEDDISAQVAEALLPELTGGERQRLAKRGTESVEAHAAYLRGRYHWNTFSEEGLARALTYFHEAVAFDPNYALPQAGIADYFNWLGVYCVLPFAETSAAAKDAALKAVALDPALAEGYAALGFATLTRDFDWAGGEANCRRAVELNPHYVTAHVWYGYQLMMEGRTDEAFASAREATRLDPLSPMTLHMLTWCNYIARRYPEAVSCARRLLSVEPRHAIARLFLSHALSATGEHDDALREGRRAVEKFARAPYSLQWLAMGHAAAGEPEEARALLAEIGEAAATRYVSPYLCALVHARLGDRDRALALLEEAYAIRDGWMVWVGAEPQLDALREEPRFRELLRLTNNPAFSRPAAPPATGGPPSRDTSPSARDTDGGHTGSRGVAPDTTRVAPPASPPRRQTTDEQAQQFYVAGRYYATRRTAEGLRKAIERLEQAVGRDPKFALAYAELADCYALLNWYVEPPPADAWECAKRAAQSAVGADDNLPEAHASLGFVTMHFDRDFARAETELRRAVELQPENAVARRWHAFNLSAMGRHEEAVTEIKLAQGLSPRSPVMATAVANVLFLARRFDEA
ncbi:MAG: protein kinase, partial [Acidobacteria bacterium]|nr:protein kinase [Acidobacteriota bacterium]